MYYDKTEGLMALCVAILRKVPPEKAFALLEDPSEKRYEDWITQEDMEDMIKMREQKPPVKYWEIGEMYGISKDVVYKRIKRFKENGGKQIA